MSPSLHVVQQNHLALYVAERGQRLLEERAQLGSLHVPNRIFGTRDPIWFDRFRRPHLAVPQIVPRLVPNNLDEPGREPIRVPDAKSSRARGPLNGPKEAVKPPRGGFL